LKSGEWFFLFVILDHHFLHAIHLNDWAKFPRPPLYLINWLLATVLMPKLAHTHYLAQHIITGLLLIGFVTVLVSATCILALTQFGIFVKHITETFNLQWQLFFFAKL